MKKTNDFSCCSYTCFGFIFLQEKWRLCCEIGGIEISSTPGISKADCNTLDDAAQAGGGSCSLK